MYNPQNTVERIKKVRIEKGISSAVLNEYCNLNKNTIAVSSNSKTGLSAKILYEVANYLECSVDYLLGRVDNPKSTYENIHSSNIVNGNNGDNSPLTVSETENYDEMTAELLKAFKSMNFSDKMDIMNAVLEKTKK